MAKAKKKSTPLVSVSQEERGQVQQALEEYHQLAVTLHASDELDQVEAALTEMNTFPEGAQLAFVKELSKEKHVDAADVLTAINELGALKSVRKEARRSLIRLEASRIYPGWQLPANRIPTIRVALNDATSRRFWKGLVTDSLDVGEAQLLLCWEQGNGYKDVRVLGFLLDYSFAGVKDFFTQVESKRSFEKYITSMVEGTPDVAFKDCTLSEGRRLVLDALEINKRHSIQPHKDYRLNLSLINELILNASDLVEEPEEPEEESVDLHDLKPEEVVTTFVNLWAEQDYRMAYDCLSQDSVVRAGLTKDEWVKVREEWAMEVAPADCKSDFVLERSPQKSKIKLPTLFSASNVLDRREIEAGWSIEVDEVPLVNTLPELSEPTTIYKETGRHWFWLRYILIQEDGVWLIQNIVDEAASAQTLSVDALKKQLQDFDVQMRKLAKGRTPDELLQLAEDERVQLAEDTLLFVARAIYYNDILIKKEPSESINYESGAGRAFLLGSYERCLSYLIPLVERFPTDHAANYIQISDIYQRLSKNYMDIDFDERAGRCEELAENALHESLAIEESFKAHLSLAELLIERDDDELLDEVETHLHQAKALTTDAEQEAHVELHLGEVAALRMQFQEALLHYQRVVDLRPTVAIGWIDLGDIYKELENFAEAETSYRRAIELEPDADDYYYLLSRTYKEDGQLTRAQEVIEEGARVNPDSAVMRLYLATNALEREDYSQAKVFLDEAAHLDPDSGDVDVFRQMLQAREELDQMRELEQPKTTRLLVPPSKQKRKKKR